MQKTTGLRPNFLLEYYIRQSHVLESTLNSIHNGADEEAIHNFRVSTKKIRALLGLVEQLDIYPLQVKPALLMRELRTIFKYMGKVRDTQILIRLLKDRKLRYGKDYHEVFSYLKKEKDERIDLMKPCLKRFTYSEKDSHVDFLHNLFEKLDYPMLVFSIIRMINKRIWFVRLRAKRIDEEETMHQIRIFMKEAMYLMNITEQFDLLENPVKLLRQKVEKLCDEMGLWHDDINLRNAIYKFRYLTNNKQLEYKMLQKDIAQGAAKKEKAIREYIIKNIHIPYSI